MDNHERIALDFMVLGAQKAGTTTLHDWLCVHPDIALPTLKETHFFSDPELRANGIAWYKSRFDENISGKLVGEVDPEYLFAPRAPADIASSTSVQKFIILLRHPLQRALSQYLMTARRGYEREAFDEALLLEQARLDNDTTAFAADHHSYTARSLYSDQILRYRQQFPDAQFLFLRSDALDESGYDRVCQFIGVDPTVSRPDFSARSNVASTVKSPSIRDAIYAANGKSAFRRAVMRLFPTSLKRRVFLWIDGLNQRPLDVDKGDLLARVPQSVLEQVAADLERLRTIVDVPVDDWIADIASRLSQKRSAEAAIEPK